MHLNFFFAKKSPNNVNHVSLGDRMRLGDIFSKKHDRHFEVYSDGDDVIVNHLESTTTTNEVRRHRKRHKRKNENPFEVGSNGVRGDAARLAALDGWLRDENVVTTLSSETILIPQNAYRGKLPTVVVGVGSDVGTPVLFLKTFRSFIVLTRLGFKKPPVNPFEPVVSSDAMMAEDDGTWELVLNMIDDGIDSSSSSSSSSSESHGMGKLSLMEEEEFVIIPIDGNANARSYDVSDRCVRLRTTVSSSLEMIAIPRRSKQKKGRGAFVFANDIVDGTRFLKNDPFAGKCALGQANDDNVVMFGFDRPNRSDVEMDVVKMVRYPVFFPVNSCQLSKNVMNIERYRTDVRLGCVMPSRVVSDDLGSSRMGGENKGLHDVFVSVYRLCGLDPKIGCGYDALYDDGRKIKSPKGDFYDMDDRTSLRAVGIERHMDGYFGATGFSRKRLLDRLTAWQRSEVRRSASALFDVRRRTYMHCTEDRRWNDASSELDGYFETMRRYAERASPMASVDRRLGTLFGPDEALRTCIKTSGTANLKRLSSVASPYESDIRDLDYAHPYAYVADETIKRFGTNESDAYRRLSSSNNDASVDGYLANALYELQKRARASNDSKRSSALSFFGKGWEMLPELSPSSVYDVAMDVEEDKDATRRYFVTREFLDPKTIAAHSLESFCNNLFMGNPEKLKFMLVQSPKYESEYTCSHDSESFARLSNVCHALSRSFDDERYGDPLDVVHEAFVAAFKPYVDKVKRYASMYEKTPSKDRTTIEDHVDNAIESYFSKLPLMVLISLTNLCRIKMRYLATRSDFDATFESTYENVFYRRFYYNACVPILDDVSRYVQAALYATSDGFVDTIALSDPETDGEAIPHASEYAEAFRTSPSSWINKPPSLQSIEEELAEYRALGVSENRRVRAGEERRPRTCVHACPELNDEARYSLLRKNVKTTYAKGLGVDPLKHSRWGHRLTVGEGCERDAERVVDSIIALVDWIQRNDEGECACEAKEEEECAKRLAWLLGLAGRDAIVGGGESTASGTQSFLSWNDRVTETIRVRASNGKPSSSLDEFLQFKTRHVWDANVSKYKHHALLTLFLLSENAYGEPFLYDAYISFLFSQKCVRFDSRLEDAFPEWRKPPRQSSQRQKKTLDGDDDDDDLAFKIDGVRVKSSVPSFESLFSNAAGTPEPAAVDDPIKNAFIAQNPVLSGFLSASFENSGKGVFGKASLDVAVEGGFERLERFCETHDVPIDMAHPCIIQLLQRHEDAQLGFCATSEASSSMPPVDGSRFADVDFERMLVIGDVFRHLTIETKGCLDARERISMFGVKGAVRSIWNTGDAKVEDWTTVQSSGTPRLKENNAMWCMLRQERLNNFIDQTSRTAEGEYPHNAIRGFIVADCSERSCVALKNYLYTMPLKSQRVSEREISSPKIDGADAASAFKSVMSDLKSRMMSLVNKYNEHCHELDLMTPQGHNIVNWERSYALLNIDASDSELLSRLHDSGRIPISSMSNDLTRGSGCLTLLDYLHAKCHVDRFKIELFEAYRAIKSNESRFSKIVGDAAKAIADYCERHCFAFESGHFDAVTNAYFERVLQGAVIPWSASDAWSLLDEPLPSTSDKMSEGRYDSDRFFSKTLHFDALSNESFDALLSSLPEDDDVQMIKKPPTKITYYDVYATVAFYVEACRRGCAMRKRFGDDNMYGLSHFSPPIKDDRSSTLDAMRKKVPPYMLDVATYPFYALSNGAYTNMKESVLQFDGAAHYCTFLKGDKDVVPKIIRNDRYLGFASDTMCVHKKSVRFVFPSSSVGSSFYATNRTTETLNANQIGFEMTMRYLFVGDRFTLNFSNHAISAFGMDTVYVATLVLNRVKSYFEMGHLNDELFQTVIESKAVFANAGSMRKGYGNKASTVASFEKWQSFERVIEAMNDAYEKRVEKTDESTIERFFLEARDLGNKEVPEFVANAIRPDVIEEVFAFESNVVKSRFPNWRSETSEDDASETKYRATREYRRIVDSLPDLWKMFVFYKTFHEIVAYEPTGFVFNVTSGGVGDSGSGAHFVSEASYPDWFSCRFEDIINRSNEGKRVSTAMRDATWEYYDDMGDRGDFDKEFKSWTGFASDDNNNDDDASSFKLAYGSDPTPWLIGAMTNVLCKRQGSGASPSDCCDATSDTYNVLTIDATDDVHQLAHRGIVAARAESKIATNERRDALLRENDRAWKRRAVDAIRTMECVSSKETYDNAGGRNHHQQQSSSGGMARRTPIIMRMGESFKDCDIRALQRYLIVSHNATLEEAGTCLSSISYVKKRTTQ